MQLNSREIKQLKGLGHHLKPVVMIGKEGISEPVKKELENTLTAHELIKVKISVDDRDDFKAMVSEVAGLTESQLVQTLGRIALFYRKGEEKSGKRKKG